MHEEGKIIIYRAATQTVYRDRRPVGFVKTRSPLQYRATIGLPLDEVGEINQVVSIDGAMGHDRILARALHIEESPCSAIQQLHQYNHLLNAQLHLSLSTLVSCGKAVYRAVFDYDEDCCDLYPMIESQVIAVRGTRTYRTQYLNRIVSKSSDREAALSVIETIAREGRLADSQAILRYSAEGSMEDLIGRAWPHTPREIIEIWIVALFEDLHNK